MPDSIDTVLSVVKKRTLVKLTRRVKRNQLCPCGSGRKFKRCCLKRLK